MAKAIRDEAGSAPKKSKGATVVDTKGIAGGYL